MPRLAVENNQRMNLRIRPEQKATLLRAAALKNTDLTDFVIQNALREAKVVIDEAERLVLSRRDSLLVLSCSRIHRLPSPGERCHLGTPEAEEGGHDASLVARRADFEKA